MNDAEFLAELPNGLPFPELRVRRGPHPNIDEDVDEMQLPGSRYTQMVSYQVNPPLSENQELALQTLFQRIRDYPLLNQSRYARVRLIRWDRGEVLVRNREGQARFDPEFINTLQAYMRFRDTVLFMFSSNEELEFDVMTIYLDLDFGENLRGGGGEGIDDSFLASKTGIELVPRGGTMCGWMALALYCVMVDERYNEYCRPSTDSMQRMKSLSDNMEQWKALSHKLHDLYGDPDSPLFAHPSCTERWLKDYPQHRMVIVDGIMYNRNGWNNPTILGVLEGKDYVKIRQVKYHEGIQKGGMTTCFLWMDKRNSLFTTNNLPHFHFIYNPNNFLKFAKENKSYYFCLSCFKSFHDRRDAFKNHKCDENFCEVCHVYLPPAMLKIHKNTSQATSECSVCGIQCYNINCKDIHESKCTRPEAAIRTNQPFCKGCSTLVTEDSHVCWIRPDPRLKHKKVWELDEVLNRYYVFDFESEFVEGSTVRRRREGKWIDLDVDTHRVNFVAVRRLGTGETWTFNSMDEFYDWMWIPAEDNDKRWGTLLAHNMKGYDGRMLFNYLLDKGVPPAKCMWVGNKIMAMELKNGNRIWKVQDTLTHLAFALEQLPGIFGLDETEFKKGYFPYKFNTNANKNYIGPLPAIKYFEPEMMRLEKKKAFLQWHAEESLQLGSNGYNFWEELKAYCVSDVNILAKAIEVYITEGMALNKMNPMVHYTIASYAQKVYIDKHMPPKSLAYLTEEEEKFARRALHGGRTDVRKMYMKWTDEDVASGRYGVYQDVQSLYPTVQFYKPMPVGKPEIIKFGPHDCPPSMDEVKSWFGFVECDLSVEQESFHPVVVAKDESGKLVADLKDKKRIVLTTPELNAALNQGYVITKVYEVHVYKQSTDLFKSYIRTFLKLKIESSGMPKHITNDSQWNSFYSYHKNQLGVDLDRSNMIKNPGRKQLAKLMLNSLWGKFAERPHNSAYIATDVPEELLALEAKWDSGKIDITYRHAYGDGKYVLVYKNLNAKARTVGESEGYVQKTNVAAASFVTAWGALTLWEEMEKLGQRVLYHDTDSIIYERSITSYNIPLGQYLGEWEDECGGLPIVEFISIGPKTYAYKVMEKPVPLDEVTVDKLRRANHDFVVRDNQIQVIKSVCKAKGFTLNAHNLGQINFRTMHQLLLGNVESLKGTTLKFVYRRGESMHTEQEVKEMKMVYDKGYVDNNFTVWPWGYDRFRTYQGPRRGWVVDDSYGNSH